MSKKSWLCALAAVLLLSAAPLISAGANAPAAQSSAKKKKSASSKGRKKSKAAAKGQKAPTTDRIREIQTALNREGSFEGQPTGKWDDSTIEAMRKFQQAHGLNPTGKVDAVTLEKLGLGSDTAGKGAPVPTASSVPTRPASAH